MSKEVNYILEQSSKQGNEKVQRRQLKFTGLWKKVGNYDSWEREISMRRNRNTGRMRVLEGQIIRYYKHTSYGQEDGTKYEHTWAQWGVDGWCNFKVKELALDTVALTDNPCTQKVEAGGSLPVWGLLGLHSASEHSLGYVVRLSKKNNNKKKKKCPQTSSSQMYVLLEISEKGQRNRRKHYPRFSLSHRDLSACDSRVLGVKACTITLAQNFQI